MASKGENRIWDPGTNGEYHFIHSMGDAQKAMRSVREEKVYIDVHAWCFVPHSFRLIIHDLFCLGLIPFQELDFISTHGGEFFITLCRNGKGINKSRLEMLDMIESEIQVGVSIEDNPVVQMLHAQVAEIYNSRSWKFVLLLRKVLGR